MIEQRLSRSEWIVLALICERPRHGFEVASLTGPEGDIGQACEGAARITAASDRCAG